MKKLAGPPEKPKIERKLLADALKKVDAEQEQGKETPGGQILELKARVYDLSRMKGQIDNEMTQLNQEIAKLERQRMNALEQLKKTTEAPKENGK